MLPLLLRSGNGRYILNKIYVVGIGPGGCDQMTGIAMEALKASDAIIGYTVYVDLVKDTFPDKEFFSTPIKKKWTAVFLPLRRL